MVQTGVFPMASVHTTLQLRVVNVTGVNPRGTLGATEGHIAPLSIGHGVRHHHIDVAVNRGALCFVDR